MESEIKSDLINCGFRLKNLIFRKVLNDFPTFIKDASR